MLHQHVTLIQINCQYLQENERRNCQFFHTAVILNELVLKRKLKWHLSLHHVERFDHKCPNGRQHSSFLLIFHELPMKGINPFYVTGHSKTSTQFMKPPSPDSTQSVIIADWELCEIPGAELFAFSCVSCLKWRPRSLRLLSKYESSVAPTIMPNFKEIKFTLDANVCQCVLYAISKKQLLLVIQKFSLHNKNETFRLNWLKRCNITFYPSSLPEIPD